METKNEGVGRCLLQELGKHLRSESGPKLVAMVVIGTIGGAFLLVSAVPLDGADAWIVAVTLSVVLAAFIALAYHHLGSRPPFYLEHSTLAKDGDPRLEKKGRVCLAQSRARL